MWLAASHIHLHCRKTLHDGSWNAAEQCQPAWAFEAIYGVILPRLMLEAVRAHLSMHSPLSDQRRTLQGRPPFGEVCGFSYIADFVPRCAWN